MSKEIDSVILKSLNKQYSSIIWLHGLGESSDGWTDVNFKLRKKFRNSKFLFPIAPIRPNGLYNNRELPSWFNITCRSNVGKLEDPEGLKESIKLIEELIQSEINKGIIEENIILGGFSQGSMALLALALQSRFKLGGLIFVSGFFNLKELDGFIEFNPIAKEIPILLLQGEDDKGMPKELAENTYKELKELNYKVELVLYPNVDHEINEDMATKINDFILGNTVSFD